ncbi:MAG: flagellar hook-length control protein FliK [Magnetococcus sp. YQC-3]
MPEDLGTLDLRLRVDANNQVHLLINAETHAARDLLQKQITELQDALARQNMGIGDVVIQVNDQQQNNHAAAQWGFAEQREQREGSVPRGTEGSGQEKSTDRPLSIVSAADGVVNIVV